MKIAGDPRIEKAARAQLLPLAWGTLYELTKLPDAEFQQALTSGAINATTTRAQASQLVRVQVEAVPVYKVPPVALSYVAAPMRELIITAPDDDEAPPMRLVASQAQPEPTTDVPPPDVASLALSQIERLVGDLSIAIERGDLRADAVFEGRIRAAADRLLSLIEHEPATIN